MALPIFHCVDCDKDFKAGDWLCVSGQKHVVIEKRYYMKDAPQCPEWINGRPHINKGASRCTVLNVPPEIRKQDGDEVIRIPGGSVEFIRGLYSTTDPHIQFCLDRKDGLCTYDEWKDAYWTDDEKLAEQKMVLAAEHNRIQGERNELLAQIKRMKEEAKPERKKPGPKPRMLEVQPT